LGVSIHAFRGEGDLFFYRQCPGLPSFNPRLPGGRRRYKSTLVQSIFEFQSTPSGGKATGTRARLSNRSLSFNPRLPGGRRPVGPLLISTQTRVSIHAFRGEGDSARRGSRRWQGQVSIHAFRGEGDDAHHATSPHTRVSIHAFRGESDFSRPASWHCPTHVSIHAFRGEGDVSWGVTTHHINSFNPRLPGGRRPAAACR